MNPETLIIAYLHSPKERLWGVLRSQDASGLWLEGIALDSFDDWARQVARKEESGIGLSLAFYPMLRVEKLVVDRSVPGQPSLADGFHSITGLRVEAYLGLEEPEAPGAPGTI